MGWRHKLSAVNHPAGECLLSPIERGQWRRWGPSDVSQILPRVLIGWRSSPMENPTGCHLHIRRASWWSVIIDGSCLVNDLQEDIQDPHFCHVSRSDRCTGWPRIPSDSGAGDGGDDRNVRGLLSLSTTTLLWTGPSTRDTTHPTRGFSRIPLYKRHFIHNLHTQ